jgi:hypothetical protein
VTRMSREDSERRAHEEYLSALSNILSGGLLVDTHGGSDLPPERALMRVTGALLKAVSLARFGDEQLSENVEWCMNSTRMTDDETREALSGIIALLRDVPAVMETLRANGEFRESPERIEHADFLREQAVATAGETVVAEREQGEIQ